MIIMSKISQLIWFMMIMFTFFNLIIIFKINLFMFGIIKNL